MGRAVEKRINSCMVIIGEVFMIGLHCYFSNTTEACSPALQVAEMWFLCRMVMSRRVICWACGKKW